MKYLFWTSILAVQVLILTIPSVADAVHTDTNAEMENLRNRIEALEKEGERPTEGFVLGTLGKHLRLGGLLELEAAYEILEGEDDTSDLSLATAELDFEATVNEHLGGHIILLHEEGETEPIEVDEAALTISYGTPRGGAVTFTGGKVYLPFGKFNSSFITDPLTLDLGETNDTAAILSWGNGLVSVGAGAFSGDTDPDGDDEHINSWVAFIDFHMLPGLTVGGSFISDLAESDIGLVTDEDLYESSVAGIAAYLSAAYWSFTLEGEYVTAAEKFSNQEVAVGDDLTGRRPAAWNLELAFAPEERWLLAIRAEGADDFQDDLTRFGAVASYGIFENAVIALEYLLGDRDGGEDDRSQTVTAQLAFQF